MTDEQKKPASDSCDINSHKAKTAKSAGSGDDAAGNASAANSAPQEDGDLTTIRQELEQTQEELKKMTTITQHALADLQNFRRRADEEKASFVAYANAALLSELLPVLESMNKALAHEPKDAGWIKGAEATMKQFQTTLEKQGLTPIDAANQTFDPKIHEALMTGPGPKDHIMREFEKGYMLGEKVIKRSRVLVGNGEEAAS